MSILVTRPSPAGEQLVSGLRARGKSAWHMPLIEFMPGNDLPQLTKHLSNLSDGDLLFIVSQHAINYAHSWLKKEGFTWPARPQYFTIGRTTGLQLHGFCGLPVSYPNQWESSEDLLRLPALTHINGKRALILRGNGGREVLVKTLRQRGVKTTCCECYRRCPIHYDGEEQGRRMQMLGIDILVITSGEMLQQFYALIPEYYRDAWLMQCRLIVFSNRLATLARKLGWTDIVVTNAANNNALMCVLL